MAVDWMLQHKTEKVLKDRIIATFPERLEDAQKRLCPDCKHRPCTLLPVTTEGEDCPYYELEAKVLK